MTGPSKLSARRLWSIAVSVKAHGHARYQKLGNLAQFPRRSRVGCTAETHHAGPIIRVGEKDESLVLEEGLWLW